MTGNKWRYFLLEFSFLGWLVLTGAPRIVYVYSSIDIAKLVSVMDADAFLDAFALQISDIAARPLTVVLGLLPLFAEAYIFAANACFYDLASGALQLQFGDIPGGARRDAVDHYEITGFETRDAEPGEDSATPGAG